MFGIGMPEMILILAIALIVIGPKKLPDLAKSLGRAMNEFKKATREIKDSMDIDGDLQEVKKSFDDLNKDVKEAVNVNPLKSAKAEPPVAEGPQEGSTRHADAPLKHPPPRLPRNRCVMNDEDKVPFTSHLEELRRRLIICFIAVAVGFVAAYGFKEQLFEILAHPLKLAMAKGDALIFTNLPEAFFTYLKVAFLTGIGIASPVIIYQFWMFPGARALRKGKTAAAANRLSFNPLFRGRRPVRLFYRLPLRF